MDREKIFWPNNPFILALIGCVILIGAGSSSFRSLKKLEQSAPEELRSSVVTLLPELEIVKVELLSNTAIEVTLKNGYDSDITAIAASVGSRRFFYSDYIYAELERHQKLAPGATDSFLYDNPVLKGEKLLIRAVVFSDRMSLGDPRAVEYILDKRAGMKMQLGRIKRSLNSLAKANESSARRRLEELRFVAESLPIRKDDGSALSTGFEIGLKHGRDFILKYISEMETNLENEKVEKFYSIDGQLQIVRHSGYENFRESFQKRERDFKGLLKRL
jgi:hypothetical protein